MSPVDFLIPLFYKVPQSTRDRPRPTWIASADLGNRRVFCVIGTEDETTWSVVDTSVAEGFIQNMDGYDPLSASYVQKPRVRQFTQSYADYSGESCSNWIIVGDCVILAPTSSKPPSSPGVASPTQAPKSDRNVRPVGIWL